MQFAASVILCVILKIISYRLDYSTMCSQYYCFETIRRGTYCEVKSISFSGQQSLGSIRKHFFAFIWEMKLGYWKSISNPTYYPQTTLLPTLLYFIVRLFVVHSLPILPWSGNVLSQITCMNRVSFTRITLIFSLNFAIPGFIKPLYSFTWVIRFPF